MQQRKTIHQLSIGQSAEFSKMFTSVEVESFAEVSGDHNPVHLNEAYASATRFKQRICHGRICHARFVMGGFSGAASPVLPLAGRHVTM